MLETRIEPKARGRRWLRWGVWICASLAALVVALYFVATSSAFLKARVLPRVGQAINADVTAADIQLSPFSSIVVRDLKVTPKGAEPVFSVSMVRARYSLMSILRGKIAIEELTLEAPAVTLVESADGTSNLDPLLKGEKKNAPSAAPGKPSPPPAVAVKSVTIHSASIRRIKNLKGGGRESVELSNVNIEVHNLKNGEAGKLDLTGSFAMDKTAPAPATAAALEAKLNGSLTFELTKDLRPATAKGNAAFVIEKATGDFTDFGALAVRLDCDATPTEVKQLVLRFTKADTALGELRVDGPLDAARNEGRLNVALLNLDRRVLNFLGAAGGIDFGTTMINSTNVVELANGGSAVNVSGQLEVARMQISRQAQTTPTLDLHCDYNVAVDRTGQSALLKTISLTGTQNQRPLLQATLDRPMTLAWGNATTGAGDAALNVSVTGLSLADWRAFAIDLAPQGRVDATLKLLSQQGGKQLAFDLDTQVRGLSATIGEKTIRDADVRAQAHGRGTDLRQFTLNEYRVELAQQGQPALAISGSGTFDRVTQDADVQIALKATLPRLAASFPQPDVSISIGALELTGRVTRKQENQSLTGQLALTDLSGHCGASRFAGFGSTADFDMAMKAGQIEIRKVTGQLREGQNAGGSFDVTGKFDQAQHSGQFAAKLVDFNQNGLRPFLESALGDKKLVSVSLSGSASGGLEANGDAALKADLQVANLVVSDAKSPVPATPLEARAQMDTVVSKSVAQVKQCLLTLTPTQRAKNELRLAGTVDFSKTNATTGNLKVTADSLDVTRYYDLFAAGGATPETKPATAPQPTPAPASAAADKEPDAINLPFKNFTAEVAVGRCYLREVDVANLQTTAKIDGGHVVVNPCQLSLNGAPVSANIDLDLGVPGYKYDITFKADKVPVEPLADSFSPTYRNQAKGNLFAAIQIKGSGVTGVNLKKSLTGQIGLSFTNANIQIVGPKVKAVLSPIALVLGAPELLQSPLDYINANIRLGNGNIEVQQFVAHSGAFLAESHGSIPIADVLTNSPLGQSVDVSLPRTLATRLQFAPAQAKEDYTKLPAFVRLTGTLGNPQAKTDKAVILGLTAAGVGGALGGRAGGVLQSVSGLLNGQSPAPATNAPNSGAPTNPQPNLRNILDLFKKPK